MTYIPSHISLPQHPKTRRLCRMLDTSLPAVIGHLHLLWYWAMNYAPDGDLTPFDAADIADAAGWEGDAATFMQALIDCGPGQTAGFIEQADDAMHIHDWEQYGGKLQQRKTANADRMRSARAEHVQRTCNAQDEHVQTDDTERAAHVLSQRRGEESRGDKEEKRDESTARARARASLAGFGIEPVKVDALFDLFPDISDARLAIEADAMVSYWQVEKKAPPKNRHRAALNWFKKCQEIQAERDKPNDATERPPGRLPVVYQLYDENGPVRHEGDD